MPIKGTVRYMGNMVSPGSKKENISKRRSPVLNIAEISSKVQFYEFSIHFTLKNIDNFSERSLVL